uniref:DNA polymerase III subunit alpha n=1 Tax=Sedimenticola sp. TaxID=1940285 RepID=UPI003D0D4E62
MGTKFIHLSVHSEYSLQDSLLRLKPLAAEAAEQGMPALALTDRMNLFAVVRFYRACEQKGIKPIIGADLLVRPDDPESSAGHRLLLLCMNREGYLNLSKLISKGYLEGQQRGTPMVDREWVVDHSSGLIALSGGAVGDVGEALCAGHVERAQELARFWSETFPGRYYLELSRTGKREEDTHIEQAIELAGELQLPVVATNDVRFLKPEEHEAHEIRVCIQEGRTLDDPHRTRRYTDRQYLRSEAEMCELFDDIPEALENSVQIAQRCNLELSFGTYYLPEFPVPDGLTIDDFFRQESRKGLDQRLVRLVPEGTDPVGAKRREYADRLELELDVITQMGFPGYFLIVADFIRWAKENGIPVGPGRGSGAGSLVAYALEITDLDPLAYDLLFERFLNPERVSMPDFDVDFCMERRDEVIDYVARKYGRDKVSQIITFGTMAAKAVVRDVGRVLGHPYGFVDRIAKLIPFEIGMTLDKALEESEELKQAYEGEEEVQILIDYALQLEGLARNPGKHAGGVVIAPSVLTDFTPFFCEQGGSNLVSQLDKDDVESIGLVKFDFLGLRTLTIIDWAVQIINQSGA